MKIHCRVAMVDILNYFNLLPHRLFEMAPDLQNLFPFAGETLTDNHEGMKEHSYIVMTSLDECLKIVHDVPKLKDELISLGAVHHIHGVTSAHFAVSFKKQLWLLFVI